MILKGLIHRELEQGLTEEDLASVIGVSKGTIIGILADTPPQDPAIWKQLARHFHMDVSFLRADCY